ncbi:MAG: YggT family protein [Clostridia bacterium]|nr:YggT family protein [Clostridia bacterium]
MEVVAEILLRSSFFFVLTVWVLMIIRAVRSFLPVDEDSLIERVVYFGTEPFVMPARALLGLFCDVDGFPVDLGFFLAFLLIGLILRLIALAF